MKSTKQIENEIWEISGKNVFSGKDTMIFVNRFTGEVREYQMVEKSINKNVIMNDKGESKIETDEIYGCNGFHRARWVEAKIEEQTEFEKEFEN